jgi:putative peptidoglycan lipid II flippase
LTGSPRASGGPSAARLILQAASVVAVATGVVRLLGLVKNQAIAATFGVGIEVESFVLAMMLPTYTVGVLGNMLPSALVPTHAAVVRERGTTAGRELVADLVSWSVVVLVLLSLVLFALWWPLLDLVGGDFGEEKRRLASQLFLLLLPGLLLHGVASLLGAALNAEKRFLVAVLAPGCVPLATALAVFLLAPSRGAVSLVLGHLAGVVLELLLLLVAARRRGFPLGFRRPRRTPDVARVLSQYLPVLGGGLLMGSTTIVDQAMAAALPQGDLATLSYANVVVAALLSIGAVAIGTAFLPYVAEMAQAGELDRIRRGLRSWGLRIVAAATPVMLAVYLAAEPLAALIYERGAFVARDTRAVGAVMALYALQIPAYTVGILCARVVSALEANHVLLRVSCLNLVLNVALNLLFIRWLGVAGIALSTAFVYVASAGVLWTWVQRRLRRGAIGA